MLAQVSGVSLGNLVARKVWYHRTSFRNYTHKAKAPATTEKIEDVAFAEVIKLVHEVVVRNGDVLRMGQITMFHNRLLDPSEKERETSNRNIKARLLTHFGDSIVIWAPPGRTSFVYRRALPTSAALERSLNALNDRREKSQAEKIKECARMIRDQINAVDDLLDWPPSESQVTTEKFMIPGLLLLELLLRHIISSRGLHTPRVDRLVSSIAQDLIYNSTNGRSKIVKHIELALSIKRSNGNKAVITWLNRYGHCISYTDVGLVETKFVDDQVQLCSSNGYVPSVMQPSIPVTFVWDNEDHNPESVYGVSLHCTNGIMIQLQEDRPSPVASTDVTVTENAENTIRK